MRVIGIVFGGATTEYNESIRATRILYRHALSKLDNKYKFRYYLLTKSNKFASAEDSEGVVKGRLSKRHVPHNADYDRIKSLANVDVIYSTLMGTCGENGNIMGLADILKVPIIGCEILASSLALDKELAKVMVKSASIPVVEYLSVKKSTNTIDVVEEIKRTIGFPCFVKPYNLGTCAFAFKANDVTEFVEKWNKTISKNDYSDTYLIEKYIPNIEVRVFVFEDYKGRLHANDEYVTKLKDGAIGSGGVLFDTLGNKLSESVRKRIVRYACKIFRLFKMKDYARIDFFVGTSTNKIYFNEANTQPFIGNHSIEFMEKDGLSYSEFIDMMIKKNL
ncbi:D-alanine--D-alanine ligase [uncultured virus]|nr:D-alanine--D-alanine ligase [uncultured virus]